MKEKHEGKIVNEEQGKEEKLEISAQKEPSAGTQTQPSGLEKKKANRRRILGIFIATIVVLIALIVGLGIHNTPENRLARQLDLGARYLEEQNYAEAVLSFEKAIQIDERCMSAYDNGIQAYLNLDEPENLRTFYEKALEAARSLEEEALDSDAEAIVSIYLAAMDVYGDTDRVLELWEEGYEKSGRDGRLRDSLVDTYLERAKGYAADGNYEESLQDYDRMLELDGQNDGVQKGLTDCLKEYLDLLMEQGDFARVQELAEKYASALPGFDFAAYLDEINLREQMEADNRAFLQRIYELMSAEDYEGMCEFCWGPANEEMLKLGGRGPMNEDTQAFWNQLERMKVKQYLYFPEGIDDQTGIGAGVYRDPDSPFWDAGIFPPMYHIYYGPYKNGSREGEGIYFSGEYLGWVFSGTWVGDAPNGKGRLSNDYSPYYPPCAAEGNLVDGLWNGRVDAHIHPDLMADGKGDVSFMADMGIPRSLTGELLAQPGIEPLGVFGFGDCHFDLMIIDNGVRL